MPRSVEQKEAGNQKKINVQARKDREAGRNERPANPNIGKPFKRYIGGDEVQKRASNFSMFNRPPVVAPAPAGSGGENGTGVPGQRTAPVELQRAAPFQPPVQNPGINPAGLGGVLPRPPIPAPPGPMGAVTGGGNTFGQMPQVTGVARPGMAQPMPQVPQRPIQYSLANRRFGA